jgi:hypothetical protein
MAIRLDFLLNHFPPFCFRFRHHPRALVASRVKLDHYLLTVPDQSVLLRHIPRADFDSEMLCNL